ncbi:hypothetical protein [Dokdonia sp.]|uniref:hypothetical protein n=1 Tax=Dokdonia sp. TaxID=2024995 RepID=UPI003263A8B7
MERDWQNIGYPEINDLLSNIDSLKKSPNLSITLTKGQIDPVFFSYVLLLLVEIDLLNVIITLKDDNTDRYYSASTQVNQINFLYSKITNNGKRLQFQFLDTDTGETNDYKTLQSSSGYIPHLLISENKQIDYFFNERIVKNKLYDLYLEKIEKEIDKILGKTVVKKDRKILLEKIEKLSFIELSILSLFVYKATKKKLNNFFKSLKGNKNIAIKENIRTISNFILSTKEICYGLKELALNIVQHSGKNGVISVRNYDKQKISLIKKRDGDENKFISTLDFSDFIDINVIDLGNKNIKEKFITNLTETKKTYIEALNEYEIKRKENNKEPINNKLKKVFGLSFDSDIKRLEQNKITFKDLFIPKDKAEGLSVQNNKLTTRIGLQYFTRLIINKYGGFIKISSLNEKAIFYDNEERELNLEASRQEDFIAFGTFYNAIIPINNWEHKNISQHNTTTNTKSSNYNTFESLEEFNFSQIGEDLKNYIVGINNIIRYKPTFEVESTPTIKDKSLIYISTLLSSYNYNRDNDIIAVNCNSIKKEHIENASQWLRFIWTLTDFFDNIILYDIRLEYFKEIINIRKLFYETEKNIDKKNIWDDENSKILFYSKNITDNEYYRYGANILAGKSIDDFNYINRKIWTHHYSYKEGVFNINKISEANKNLGVFNSVLFSGSSKNLRYFEVLLNTQTENEDKISLFEKSVQYSLNTLLQERRTENTNNKGYKIQDTHFRLGSKIHISDFYYAKKLFQNSFFTTPLAYQISENIWKDHSGKLLDKNDELKSFTLIGYENYSSLLISSIRNFLTKKIEQVNDIEIKINHLTIDKDGQLSRERHKLMQNVIIVVPIATSFNTSLKIEDQLNGIVKRGKKIEVFDFLKINVLQPTQNVILVAHRPINEDGSKSVFLIDFIDNKGKFIKEKIYSEYNWKIADKENKKIIVERYNFPRDEREQKYLVPVYTTWHKANECKLCYPEGAYDERCLIETGQASITPQIIFSFPKTKPYHSIFGSDKNYLSLEGSLLYGNLKKKNNQYLYYNRTGKVITNNEEEIKNWIIKLKERFEKNEIYKKDFIDKKVVVVTPSSGSRSNFLDLINEFLYEYTANCIIISLQEDYIENSETLYSDGLYNADTIVYVDDVLSTAKSFLDVNYIIKYIRNKNHSGKGIDYCFTLINRLAFSDENNILLKLKTLEINKNTSSEDEDKEKTKKGEPNDGVIIKSIPPEDKLIYYYKINNPTIEETNKKFPLEIEKSKYDYLEKRSSLDEVRNYFYKKRKGIEANNLNKTPSLKVKDYSLDFEKKKKRNKKLYQALVLNALYTIFEYDFSPSSNNEKEIINYKKKADDKWLEIIQHYFPLLKSEEDKVFKLDKKGYKIVLESINNIKNKIEEELKFDLKHRLIIYENKNNLDYTILKVICSTPLIYYKQIRKIAFYWVHIKINRTIKIINRKLENHPIAFYELNSKTNYSIYQDLKFLLKKSIKLQSNIIFHKDTFKFYKVLIEKLNKIEPSKKSNAKKRNKSFTKNLQEICKNKVYLNIPTIKLFLYDFVQNNIKNNVIEEFTFDSKKITKKGIENEDKKITDNYHKSLIKEHYYYRDQIANSMDSFETNNNFPLINRNDKASYTKFRESFYNLLIENPRYKLSNTKKLINHLVALVQELVIQNETKSIKLDKVLKNERENDYDPNCNESATYNHLLRLLHLENTEILNKYAEEFIPILIDKKIEDLNKTLLGNKKYEQLVEVQNKDETSLNHFLYVKKLLSKKSIKKQKDSGKKIQKIIRPLLSHINKIIGERVEDIFFTINYKEINKYDKDDIHTFSLNDSSTKRLEFTKEKNSLTTMMGEERFKSDNDLYSHFEVRKDNLGGPSCRNDKEVKRNIIKTEQFKELEKEKSILLIRISDFIENDIDKEQSELVFNTLGIFTIYLNQSTRLNEKKLRLLLALRQDFTSFIKNETAGTSFLGLISVEIEENLIKNNAHYLNSFKSNLEQIVKKINNFESDLKIHIDTIDIINSINNLTVGDINSEFYKKEDLLKTHKIILDAVFSQINMIKINHSSKFYSKKTIEEFIILILKSKLIEGSSFSEEQFTINLDLINKLYMNILQYNIIIPQLLINIKRYTDNNLSKNIEIYFKDDYLIFKNRIGSKSEQKKRIRGGKSICKNLMQKTYNIEDGKLEKYISFKTIGKNHFVKLKITKHE